MRLDKFLKVSRIIKRRAVANEACDRSYVTVNGAPAKASRTLKVGDVVEVAFGTRVLKFRVLSLQETVPKAQAQSMYELLQ